MEQYIPQKVEKKWQKKWEEQGLYAAQEKSPKPKLYVLDMFPYPSGNGLHVGHVEGYTATDIYSRFKRMQGYNVLHPMGWDAFGLPAENYAIKTGVHPKETTEKAIDTFRRQIKDLGLSYDWSREIGTQTPEYYKWTQWLFLLMYKNGLAYKAKANVNWCDSCKTVLANEQVVNGLCERSKDRVVQKELEQWFFKITDFAEDLINDLDKVDWPESTVRNQRNWIGKSHGINLDFQLEHSKETISVFTTRVDTIFSGTFLILAPEHPLVGKITAPEQAEEVKKYISESSKKNELERTEIDKNKTGVFTGAFAINPASKERMPIWVADFVLANYGTGAVFADAHDERDFELAKKYDIPLKVSLRPKDDVLWEKVKNLEVCYPEEGILVNSMQCDGLSSAQAREKIAEWLEREGAGKRTINYHLRDWLISRQRYWGAPIPIVYDPAGNAHPIPEKHLPWLLPTDVEFKPSGYSPLADSQELAERTEKIFGKGWKPEADTMDTFVCSSWYYLRFADPDNKNEFASKEAMKRWLPVDVYMGGAEHTVLHLMYARFFTKVLHKLGYVDFTEPFLKLRHQGTILAEDGRKMSKSLGNVVNPDEAVAQYGADAVRLYEMFVGPLADAKPWNTKSIVGIKRFLERVWRLQEKVQRGRKDSAELQRILHYTIKKAGEDMATFEFNTTISQLMICSNAMEQEESISAGIWESFVLLLAPFAPHIAEELWSALGHAESVHTQTWPAYDPEVLMEETVRIVLQVNGKVRDIAELPQGVLEKEVRAFALQSDKIQRWMAGKQPKRIVYVPGKLLNIVV